MQNLSRACIIFPTAMVAGCTSFSWEAPPLLEINPAERDLQECVVEHIQTELRSLADEPSDERDYSILKRYDYVASLVLQSDVTHSEGLNASLTYTDLLKPLPVTSQKTESALIGGQLSGTQHVLLQTYTPVAFKDLAEDSNHDGRTGCMITTGLKGDLGLKAIFRRGFNAIDAANRAYKVADGPLKASGGAGFTPSPDQPIVAQIDFQIIEGVSGGPTLSATHFKLAGGGGGSASGGASGGGSSGGSGGSGSGGAGGGSQAPINLSRTTKDTLIISFTPTCRPPQYVMKKVQSSDNRASDFEMSYRKYFNADQNYNIVTIGDSASPTSGGSSQDEVFVRINGPLAYVFNHGKRSGLSEKNDDTPKFDDVYSIAATKLEDRGYSSNVETLKLRRNGVPDKYLAEDKMGDGPSKKYSVHANLDFDPKDATLAAGVPKWSNLGYCQTSARAETLRKGIVRNNDAILSLSLRGRGIAF